jgi:hypothetical protein
MREIFILIALFSFQSFAQILNPVHFPMQSDSASNKESVLLGLPDNSMMMFWYDTDTKTIYSSKSTDEGVSWSNIYSVYSTAYSFDITEINAVVLNTGRIILTFNDHRYYSIYSDDSGLTWSDPVEIPLGYVTYRYIYSSLSNNSQGGAFFIYNNVGILDSTGMKLFHTGDGINWYYYQVIDSAGRNGNIVSVNLNKNILVYEMGDTSHSDLVFRTSTDGGYSWSDRQTLLSDGFKNQKPRLIKYETGKLWLLYYRNDSTAFQNYSQDEIYFLTSTDEGITWSQPEKFTDYAGNDELVSLSAWNGSPIVSFTTSRDFYYDNESFQIYYGIPGISIDDSTPPYLFDFSAIPQNPQANEPITFRAFADDENSLNSVKIIINIDANIDSLEMYDDGMHGDSLAGDNIYGYIQQDGLLNGYSLNYDFLLQDADGNNGCFKGGFIQDPAFTYIPAFRLDANRLKLPFDNQGVLADVLLSVGDSTGLLFDESSVLFSGGFLMSGLNQGEIWTNGVAPSFLILDYLPGPVGGIPGVINNSIYVVKASDAPFAASWINYQYAVDLGADFYDGNNNGVYDPVDLNGNGEWDLNEDRPDLLGDVTAWCVYNDALPSSQRRFTQVSPMGIEVMQTLFAIGDDLNPVNNMIFIRYRIVNIGTVSTEFDSVYFGLFDDPDIGADSYTDDLVGSDTLLNLGYSYNDGDDGDYGINPPSIAFKILAGPPIYIPGETYIDINGNNQYDEGIDTPLDTAFINRGEILGAIKFPGAKNLGLTSIMEYINGDPGLNEPHNRIEARNNLLGLSKAGDLFDPCTFSHGTVFGVPCDQVNPLFLYSGDPVTNTGWINTDPADQRILTNTGPFTLKQDEPIVIWAAYIVGRGSSALGSVSKTKEYAESAQYFYDSNFSQLPTDVKSDFTKHVAVSFKLSQNFPNPFNPTTRINFNIGKKQLVKLKVFDILGREVITLVNEEKLPGNYTVKFDGSRLASGVYFYQITAGSYIETRKMILLK